MAGLGPANAVKSGPLHQEADEEDDALIKFGDDHVAASDRPIGRCDRGAHPHPISNRGRAKAKGRCHRRGSFDPERMRRSYDD